MTDTPPSTDTPSSEDAQAPATDSSSAAVLPPLYRNPEPLDPTRHGKLGLSRNFNLGFSRNVNAVPVNALEMVQACHFYPLVFSPGATAAPIALIGLRDKENLFVDEQGRWVPEAYIPSYVRRYPFVFAETPGRTELALCVDVTEGAVEERDEGRFFNDDGSPTELSRNALEFCKSFQGAMQPTQAFSKDLHESGLLVERSLGVDIGDGQRVTLGGFRAVDEKKLQEMPDETFLEWRRKGWLSLIYAHLFSAGQADRLAAMLRKRLAAETGSGSESGNGAAAPAANDAANDGQ
jgi:hypothetical protein